MGNVLEDIFYGRVAAIGEPDPIESESSECVMPIATMLVGRHCEQGMASVIARDLAARSDAGKEKYGTRLKTNNGRNAAMDAYQEALDMIAYSAQALMEAEEAGEDTDACEWVAFKAIEAAEAAAIALDLDP